MMFTLIHTLNQYTYIYTLFFIVNKYPYCMNKMVTVNRHRQLGLSPGYPWPSHVPGEVVTAACEPSKSAEAESLDFLSAATKHQWFDSCNKNSILRNLQNTGYSCHNMPNVSWCECTLFIIVVDLAVISMTSSLDTESNRMHWVQILRLAFSPRWRQTALAGPCPAPGSALQWSCQLDSRFLCFPVITDTKAISLSANLWLTSKTAAGVMHRALAQ